MDGRACRVCLFMLRDLSLHSGDTRMAELHARYAATLNEDIIAEAVGLAAPAHWQAAKQRATLVGLVEPGGSPIPV